MPKKKSSAPASAAPHARQQAADVPALPPAALTVLSLLDAQNATTAAELATRTGLGRSTVTKALSVLHDVGLAVRHEGGHQGSRRIADRWFTAPDATTHSPAASDHAEKQSAADTAVHAQPAEPVAGTANDTTSKSAPHEIAGGVTTVPAPSKDAATAEPGQADEQVSGTGPGPEDGAAEPADESTGQAGTSDGQGPEAPAAEHDDSLPPAAAKQHADGLGAADGVASAPHTAGDKTAAPRLGKGELRARVEDHLRAHPSRTWTPSAIARTLNRSAGAIANACEKLLETGNVTAPDDAPRRFQWRPDGASDTV